MGAPTVYRWDDDQAPVARGERESLIEILTACLVAGYGSKPAAGWTKEFENVDGTKAVFRNNPVTGTGFFLRVDATAGVENAHYVQGYESMADIDTGTAPFTASSLFAITSSAAGTAPRPWILIADDRFFHFLVWRQTTGTPTATDYFNNYFAFGDIISVYDGDNYNCILMAGTSTSWNWAAGQLNSATYTGISNMCLARDRTGQPGAITCGNFAGSGPASHNYMGKDGALYETGGPIYLAKPFINDGAAYTVRGFLPGFYYPCHQYPFDNFQELSVDGKTFLAFHFDSGSYHCQIAIDIGATFRP